MTLYTSQNISDQMPILSSIDNLMPWSHYIFGVMTVQKETRRLGQLFPVVSFAIYHNQGEQDHPL